MRTDMRKLTVAFFCLFCFCFAILWTRLTSGVRFIAAENAIRHDEYDKLAVGEEKMISQIKHGSW